MKLKFKEAPKGWRVSAKLVALGLVIVISALHTRRQMPTNVWYVLLVVLSLVTVCAWLQRLWFLGFCRLLLRLRFYSGRFIGRCVVVVFFIFILTPLGWVLRLMGKDLLQLKRPHNASTYWHQATDAGPLNRPY
jgi:hypothetical protein